MDHLNRAMELYRNLDHPAGQMRTFISMGNVYIARRDAVRAQEAFRNAMNGAPLATSLGILTQAAIEQSGDDRRCAFYIADRDGAHRTHVVRREAADEA